MKDFKWHKERICTTYKAQEMQEGFFKLDNTFGDGYIGFFEVYPNVYVRIMHFILKQDYQWDLDFSEYSHFNYQSSFFNPNKDVVVGDGDLQKVNKYGLNITSKDFRSRGQALKGQLASQCTIYYSDDIFEIFPNPKVEAFHKKSTHFFRYFHQRDELKHYTLDFLETKDYSDSLKYHFYLAKAKELVLILMNMFEQEQDQMEYFTEEIPNVKYEALFRAHDCIMSDLKSTPSVEELSKKVGLNIKVLQKLFKKVFGYTVYQYYSIQRLIICRDLLITGKYTIKSLAYDYNFNDFQHFSSSFKKQFGLAPSKYLEYYQYSVMN